MIKHIRQVLLIIILLTSYYKGYSQNDSILTLDQFLYIVKNYHPVARQSSIIPQTAKMQLRIARGEMDPVIYSNYDNKTFDNKNYWSLLEAKVKIPVWYGIDITGGYQYFTGYYLDPSETTPSIGLPSAGINVSLGKGLWMNDRMAAIKQSKIFARSSVYEQQLMLNDLYYNAIIDYWEWALSKNTLDIQKKAADLAKIRLEAIKISHKYGDKPAVDTLEATIVYQTRLASLQQSELNFIKAGLKLSNHLWYENETPIELSDNIQPENLSSLSYKENFNQDSLNKILSNLESIHPLLQTIDLKLDILDIEQKLKTNKLLPTIDVNYNFLYNDNNLVFIRDNYKFGVNFKFPLFLRKERGELKMTQLKIKDTKYKLQQKNIEIKNKLLSNFNEYRYMLEQELIYNEMVNNYQKLLKAENNKFQIGESSVFMVNSREIKLIEAEIKLAEVRSKLLKSYSSIYWASGILSAN